MMKQLSNLYAAHGQFRAVLFGLLVLGAAVGTTEALTNAIFVFGDSLVDAGNNNDLPNPIVPKANFFPYGESFFFPPTGRFSNGRLAPDFIASYLGLPFAPAYEKLQNKTINPLRFAKGANFGSAGAGILDATNANLGVIPLRTQFAQFQGVAAGLRQVLGPIAPVTLSNALYVIFIGSNDVGVYFANQTLQATVPIGVYLQTLVATLASQVQILLDNGAQKIFIDGLGPIGCTPQTALINATISGTTAPGPNSGPSVPCLTVLNQAAQGFNQILLAYINSVNQNGVKIVYGNAYDTTLDLIQNGPSRGFTQGLTACCGTGPFNGNTANGVGFCGRGTYNLCPKITLPTYIYFDAFHPTERVYELGAQGVFSGGPNGVYPINIFQLTSRLTFP